MFKQNKYKIDFQSANDVFVEDDVRRIETFSRWFLIFCVFVAIFVFMVNFVYETAPVSGPSMENTFNQYGDDLNDTVIINTLMKYNYGDIVVVDVTKKNSKTKEFHIKRIVGMPGDVIDIVDVDGNYYLERNGKIVDEKYIKSRVGMIRTHEKFEILQRDIMWADSFNSAGKFVVPEGEIFVLGDNRANSEDSSIKGSYKKDQVIGKVQYVVPHGVGVVSYVMKNLFRLPEETNALYANV